MWAPSTRALGGEQAAARLGRAPLPLLDARARDLERDPALGRGRRRDVDRLEERRAALGQSPGAGERPRAALEQVEPADRGLRPDGHEPQRGRVPARGARRGAPRAVAGGLLEERDRVGVAVAGGVLGVAGTGRRRGVAGGQGGAGALVGADPPPRAGGLVDGVADERAAECEAARDAGRADEAAGDELVEGGEDLALRALGDLGDEVGLERLARDGRGLEHGPRGGRDGGELAAQRHRDGGRDVLVRARELLEVEGVAGAAPVEGVGRGRVDARAEQLARRGPVERAERHRRRAPLALGAGLRRGEAGRDAARARGPGDQDRRLGRAVEQRDEQVGRGGVGVLEVVEDEDRRAVAGECLEQRADGAVGAVPLARAERGADAGRAGRRQDRREGRVVAGVHAGGGGRTRAAWSSASIQTA